jgi:acetyltransferase-like isoleucine patch superfamily enzyme
MRQDRRPYWVKKSYLLFRHWYSNHFLAPACDSLGPNHTLMKPWYISISGPNIDIGKCVTIIAEPGNRVQIGVWGREADQGRICIGDYVLISPGVRISAGDEIIIEDNAMIANGVYITDSDWHGIYDRTARSDTVSPVRIGKNAWLGDGSRVLKGVTIGENSIVAAGAVVSRDVPANVVVAGNPAVVVKELDGGGEFIKRSDFFADPEGLEQFFDAVDAVVLADNSLLNWLRGLVAPSRRD